MKAIEQMDWREIKQKQVVVFEKVVQMIPIQKYLNKGVYYYDFGFELPKDVQQSYYITRAKPKREDDKKKEEYDKAAEKNNEN